MSVRERSRPARGRSPLALMAAALLALVATSSGGTAGVAAAAPTRLAASPCSAGLTVPFCTSALGALRDVSTTWRQYQASLTQPIPIADYAADPEDAAPPLGAGVCGGETVHQPAGGTTIPAATVQSAPPAGIPAPPGEGSSGSPYCVLRYIPADFTPLCAGCARLFVDFSAIPQVDVTANPAGPGADGHFAMRLTTSDNNAAALINGHSPNVKNLCSDKFVNPSPGADCSNAIVSGFDTMGFGVEGDTGRFVHYPLEGRYFNGPGYLAGDGASTPYHWVHGFYMDIRIGTSASAWYAGGYRGFGDPLPDTDQSYACVCETVHTTFSADVRVAALSAVAGSTTPGAPAVAAAGSQAGLPGTAARRAALLPAVFASTVLLVVAWRRRRLSGARE